MLHLWQINWYLWQICIVFALDKMMVLVNVLEPPENWRQKGSQVTYMPLLVYL